MSKCIQLAARKRDSTGLFQGHTARTGDRREQGKQGRIEKTGKDRNK